MEGLRPTERCIILALKLKSPQTVDQLRESTGVHNIYQMKTNLRTLVALGLVIKNPDDLTAYSLVEVVL